MVGLATLYSYNSILYSFCSVPFNSFLNLLKSSASNLTTLESLKASGQETWQPKHQVGLINGVLVVLVLWKMIALDPKMTLPRRRIQVLRVVSAKQKQLPQIMSSG